MTRNDSIQRCTFRYLDPARPVKDRRYTQNFYDDDGRH